MSNPFTIAVPFVGGKNPASHDKFHIHNKQTYYYYFFDPGTQLPGKKKIMLCKEKIRKQAGMVFTPPPSQNYQEVE